MKQLLLFCSCLFLVGQLQSQSLHPDWLNHYPEPDTLEITDIQLSDDDYIYICGHYAGTDIDFDPGAGTHEASGLGNFISKFTTDGELEWSMEIGEGGMMYKAHLEVDADNNLYISGAFYGDYDVDPGTDEVIVNSSIFSTSGLVIKLDSDGNYLWHSLLESSYVDISATDLSANGDIAVVGNYVDSILVHHDGGFEELENESASWGSFLVKYDSDGGLTYANNYHGDGYNKIYDVEFDLDDNAIIGGLFYEELIYDQEEILDPFNTMWGGNGFLIKVDDVGDLVWAEEIASDSSYHVGSIETDDDGNIYTSGSFSNELDIELVDGSIITLEGVGFQSGFLRKRNSAGGNIWAIAMETSGWQELSEHIHIGKDDLLYYRGPIFEDIDADPGSGVFLLESGYGHRYISRFNLDGVFNYAYLTGSVGWNEHSDGMVADAAGNAYYYGKITEETDFDQSDEELIITPVNWQDNFFEKLVLDSCYLYAQYVNNYEVADCDAAGEFAVAAEYGMAPYTYMWNDDPALTDSNLVYTEGGQYTLTLGDAEGCESELTYILEGPIDVDNSDLHVVMTHTAFRPGFQTCIWLDAFNVGCSDESGSLHLVLNELMDYDSANIAPSSMNGDTLFWNYADLSYLDEHIQPKIWVTISTDAVLGEELCLESWVDDGVYEEVFSNNSDDKCAIVINGFDPNDIQVSPQGACEERYVDSDEPLTYTIRFQNTGNAEAINVRVENFIMEYLDIESVNILSYSHDMIATVEDGRLIFHFDDINLPDSTSDLEGSQGFVTYSILALEDVMDNSVVENSAEIYFDFNEPIYTNIVWNTLIGEVPDCSGAISVEEIDALELSVYPNPAKEVLWYRSDVQWNSYRIINMQGQLLQSDRLLDSSGRIDISELPKGMYMIEFLSETDQLERSFIKD